MKIGTLKTRLLILIVFLNLSCVVAQISQDKKPVLDRKWWKEAVVYQIYPRSFKDTKKYPPHLQLQL